VRRHWYDLWAMNSPQEQQVTFTPIRGGRFSAVVPASAAQQLADGVGKIGASHFCRISEREAMQTRLTSGQPLSQGDILALIRFRPQMPELGRQGSLVMEQLEKFVRERIAINENRPGLPNNALRPILVLPPRPTSVEE
jgi:hypothetical protein